MNAESLVLLVEDEASLRRSLTKYLERAGYAFECCATARDALALAERLDPDIVITEYHLPDANGLRLLEQLIWMLPDAAVILLSEYDYHAVVKAVFPVGVLRFLKKPFDLVDLEVALCSARSNTMIRPVENSRRRFDAALGGVTGSIFKQGTPRN